MWFLELYPIAWLWWKLGWGPEPRGRLLLSLTETIKVNLHPKWLLTAAERLSACDNRPGLKKLYLRVPDDKGEGLENVKIRFGWESGQGIAYDHPDIWGITDGQGFLEWDTFGVPTRYSFYMEDEETPLVENIRTDLGNEYCNPGTWQPWAPGGWRPVNRPGIYSYRFEVQRKVDEEIRGGNK